MLHIYQRKQSGAVMMVMLVILVIGALTFLLNTLNSTTLQNHRDQITSEALAQAKEALTGYAASADLTGSNRPGDLPCPDINNDGVTDSPCGNAAGTTGQTLRLGRLPWKTLGLPDLRDGSGERLWYAVSNNFKKSASTAVLNSETLGTISVFSPEGVLINDGAGNTGAVAIIIAPGEVLTRLDSASPQNRSCTIGINCDALEKCTTSPSTLTPKCDPKNYLDIPSAGVNPKDNDKFTDGSSSDGFIQGRIKDANGKVILNDQLLVITQDSIMQAIQKRVAREIIKALNFYYSFHYFYPRPADFSDNSCLGSGILAACNSAASNRGRIPANPATAWAPTSILNTSVTGNWFQDNRWREVFYYAVAGACTDGTTNCNGAGYLTLNNPPASPSGNQKIILVATGAALTGQTRSGMGSPKNTVSNYLEDENLVPLDNIYTKSAAPPFNDIATSIP